MSVERRDLVRVAEKAETTHQRSQADAAEVGR